MPYLDNLRAIKHCKFCVTDSGGIQREAYYANRRCVVRSDLTIWKDVVDAGNNITCDASLVGLKNALMWADSHAEENIAYNNCFGSGFAVRTIFEEFLKKHNAVI